MEIEKNTIILKNLHKMLVTRKLNIEIESLSNKTTIINNKILLLFLEEKLSLKNVKEIYDSNSENGIERIIFIVSEKPGPSILKFMNDLKYQNSEAIFLEYFTYEELMYNPMEHIYVPNHILLSKDQKADILKAYKAPESKFPRILDNDRICRYIGGKKGDLIKIVRETVEGKQEFYRIVVEGKIG